MRGRPEGETRKDRARQWLVGLGAVLLLLSVTGNIALSAWFHNASTNLQHTIIAKDNAIESLLTSHTETLQEVANIEKQVATVINKLPAADAVIAEFAIWIEDCLSTGDCSNPPKL